MLFSFWQLLPLHNGVAFNWAEEEPGYFAATQRSQVAVDSVAVNRQREASPGCPLCPSFSSSTIDNLHPALYCRLQAVYFNSGANSGKNSVQCTYLTWAGGFKIIFGADQNCPQLPILIRWRQTLFVKGRTTFEEKSPPILISLKNRHQYQFLHYLLSIQKLHQFGATFFQQSLDTSSNLLHC